MRLARLRIDGLRCLNELEVELDAARNLIVGPNGAGKTSILEGIHVLGRGRSFRTHDTRQLIQRGKDGFAVYGEVLAADGQRHRLGVGLDSTGSTRRVNGEPRQGMADMASLLPVTVMDPGGHQLIEGGPRSRRQFLDWAVFHVERRYVDWWRQYRRALAQRNAGLKAAQHPDVVAPWSQALELVGEEIHAARQAYVEALAAPLAELGTRLLDAPLEIHYARGWRKDFALAEALAGAWSRDREAGATQVGPHRADWQLVWQGHPVRQGASRGQQKLAAMALILAQALASQRAGADSGLLLVDDPAAELDQERLERLVEVLDTVPGQQVVTALSAALLAPRSGNRVFHVERGMLRRVV